MKKSPLDGKHNLTGTRIRQIRRSQRLGQNELAGKLAAQGISIDRTVITKIENRTRGVLDYELMAIAKALKVGLTELFGEPPEWLTRGHRPISSGKTTAARVLAVEDKRIAATIKNRPAKAHGRATDKHPAI